MILKTCQVSNVSGFLRPDTSSKPDFSFFVNNGLTLIVILLPLRNKKDKLHTWKS
mgnify:CR=1 FL=1